MNNKIPHYPVIERRLRPIYDLLDTGNNKKAIQEAEKVLKKHPTLHCAKVLKALALLRMGKEAESLELLEGVRKNCPTDDSTLQAMTLCYRDLNMFQVICELYDAAKNVDPTNEDLLINLFYAYVRVGDYEKQKLTALALCKIKKNKYYFWAIISILLGAIPNDDLLEHCLPPLSEFKKPVRISLKRNDSQKVSLQKQIAKRILDRTIAEKELESLNEVLLSLVVMETCEDYEAALNILIKLDKQLPHNILLKKKVDLYIKMGEWNKANKLLKILLTNEPDSWCLTQFYLESVFQLIENSNNSRDFDADDSLPKATKFIMELIQTNKHLRKRGPYLAQLELYKMMLSKHFQPLDFLPDIEDLIFNYVNEFKHLDCCTRDLVPYLPLLTKNEVKSVLNLIWKNVGIKPGKYPVDKDQMAYHLNNLELTRASGIHDSLPVEEKVTLAASLVNYFIHALSFNKDLPSTESRSSDRYIILAVHVFYDLWIETVACNYLFEAIVICHFGLMHSHSNQQLKLLLVKLYHILGGVNSAHAMYKDLDIKHMQIDSFGYFHLWPTVSSGKFEYSCELLSSALKFYNTNCKECVDHVTLAYKYDALYKIPEFINIKESLNNSLHYRLVKVEGVLLQLVQTNTLVQMTFILNEKENLSLLEDFDWSNLYDNRDFRSLWDMDGAHKCPRKDDELSMNHELVLLKLRMILFKFITLVVNMDATNMNQCASAEPSAVGRTDSSDDTSGYESGTSDTSKTLQIYELNKCVAFLQDLSRELAEVLNSFKDNPPCEVPQNSITAPPVSRLFNMIKCRYFSLIQYEMDFLHGLLQTGEECDPEEVQTSLNCIFIYFKELTAQISKTVADANAVQRTNILRMTTLYLEIVSYSCIVYHTLEGIFKQNKPTNKKTKKKKEQHIPSPEDTENNWKEEMVKDFKQCLGNSIKEVISLHEKEFELWFDKVTKLGSISSLAIEDDGHFKSMLNLSHNIVSDSIYSSHHDCLLQIDSLLKERYKHLNM